MNIIPLLVQIIWLVDELAARVLSSDDYRQWRVDCLVPVKDDICDYGTKDEK